MKAQWVILIVDKLLYNSMRHNWVAYNLFSRQTKLYENISARSEHASDWPGCPSMLAIISPYSSTHIEEHALRLEWLFPKQRLN